MEVGTCGRVLPFHRGGRSRRAAVVLGGSQGVAEIRETWTCSEVFLSRSGGCDVMVLPLQWPDVLQLEV